MLAAGAALDLAPANDSALELEADRRPSRLPTSVRKSYRSRKKEANYRYRGRVVGSLRNIDCLDCSYVPDLAKTGGLWSHLHHVPKLFGTQAPDEVLNDRRCRGFRDQRLVQGRQRGR